MPIPSSVLCLRYGTERLVAGPRVVLGWRGTTAIRQPGHLGARPQVPLPAREWVVLQIPTGA